MVEANELGLCRRANEAVARERVLQECRDRLSLLGEQQQHLMLSMLGVALSDQARAYLHRVNLGLKHFLARFPHEFRVEGPQGSEKVIWCPNATTITAAWAAEAASCVVQMPHAPSSVSADINMLLSSPTSQMTHDPLCQNTPSDWGTPNSFESEGPAKQLQAPTAKSHAHLHP